MGTAVFFNIKELGAVKAEKNEMIVCRYGTSWYNNIEYTIIYQYLRKEMDTSMTIERKVSSIESSFRMENMKFDAECRTRVRNVLTKKISAADAVAELNKKYKVSSN